MTALPPSRCGVYHLRLDENPSRCLHLLAQNRVDEVYLDIGSAEIDADRLLATAIDLRNKMLQTRVTAEPVVIGPVLQGQHGSLTERLSRELIRNTTFSFDDYCAGIERHLGFTTPRWGQAKGGPELAPS